MNNHTINISNFDALIDGSADFDIIHDQIIQGDEKLVKSTIVTISFNDKTTTIKFNLIESNSIDEDDFLIVPENQFVFYRGITEWLVFDIGNKIIRREAEAFCFPSFERKKEVIIIYDELSIECTDLEGNHIDSVPVDPPYECIEYEDKIEFDSPVYGKRLLNFKKTKP